MRHLSAHRQPVSDQRHDSKGGKGAARAAGALSRHGRPGAGEAAEPFQTHLRREPRQRSPRHHPHRGVSEEPDPRRAEAVRHDREAADLRPPAGLRVRRQPHPDPRGRAHVPHHRLHARGDGLEGALPLRPGRKGRGRRIRRPARAAGGRYAARAPRHRPREKDPAAQASRRRQPAEPDGARGAADRGRGAARADARFGPRHAGHPRRHHRAADSGGLRAAQGQAAALHRKGAQADLRGARRDHLRRDHRQVGAVSVRAGPGRRRAAGRGPGAALHRQHPALFHISGGKRPLQRQRRAV